MAITLRVLVSSSSNHRRPCLPASPSQLTPRRDCGPRPAKPRLPARAVVLHSAPSHLPVTRGRPNAAQRRFTPTRRTLVAALASRTTLPRAPNSRIHAVTRRLHIAPAGDTLVAATAAPRQGSVNSARSRPDARSSHPSNSDHTPLPQGAGSARKVSAAPLRSSITFFSNRFEPAVLGASGSAAVVGVGAFLGSVAFTHISSRHSKGGAMKIARNFVGAILNAVAVVASAVLASIAASALLPQAGCPTNSIDFGYPVNQ